MRSTGNILLYFINIILVAADNVDNPEALLVKELFSTGYDPGVRPVYHEDDTINMTINVNQLSLLNLDPSAETVLFSAEFLLVWHDVFLTWEPKNHSNIIWLKLKESLVWLPDVVLSTSIDQNMLLDANDRYLDLKYDGTVRKSLYAVFTNLCNMKVNKFPYDSQVCIIDVGPWSYTAQEVYTIPGGNVSEGADGFQGNSEWDFLYLNSQFKPSEDEDVGFNYTEVRFELKVKRRPLFYVWVLLVPTFIITTVSLIGLFVPTNSLGEREEKVNLGLTTLLSSAVILQIVADSMPKTTALPLLGNFILAEIFMVAAGVVASVVVLTLHYRANTRDWNPPLFILQILQMTGSKKYLSKVYGVKTNDSQKKKEKKSSFKGAGSDLMNEMNNVLANLTTFLERREDDVRREIVWLKFFDRLDFLFLVLFQITNIIVTIVIVDH